MERNDEVYIKVEPADFGRICLDLHGKLKSPVMAYFVSDERENEDAFRIYCVFLDAAHKRWQIVYMDISGEKRDFDSISKQIHSASLFERQIKEMYGINPAGNPDLRRLSLHDEVWPEGACPMRKDFDPAAVAAAGKGAYDFKKVEGEGIFEVPVGPVHAGIIGPGHFRFSVAGEPIINLESRLGFTHRGVEKVFEGRLAQGAVNIAECVSGTSAFSHSIAFSHAVEKIYSIAVPKSVLYMRAALLELERIYNHIADMGGIALDVGFSFPAAHASLIKESVLSLNKRVAGHRYLKGINGIGGFRRAFTKSEKLILSDSLDGLVKEFGELKNILLSNTSFMDRIDATGILRNKTAEDLGIVGLAARASGISMDLRKDMPGIYSEMGFNPIRQSKGDVLARLNMRFEEFTQSIGIIRQCLERSELIEKAAPDNVLKAREGYALGYSESWIGPVLYWVKVNESGVIERCKIVDASFHNWQGLSYAVLGNIIPDFPLCNKSFDLSYSANDL